MYRNIFKHIHYPTINKLCSSKKYPWGWVPPSYIKSLVTQQKHVYSYPINYEGDNTYFYEPEFCDGALHAYKTVMKHYNENGDFLNTRFTSPALSLVINKLTKEKKSQIINCEIDNVEIIDKWLEEEHTYGNQKVFGLWCKNDMHYVMSGIIGPEIIHIWSQRPIKQVVKVHFSGPNRNDIWLFEKCLMEPDSFWQIKNINNIIIELN